MNEYWGDTKGYYGGTSSFKRCWQKNHKPIKILNGEILGAVCAHPQKGFDVYVGLDHGMVSFVHSMQGSLLAIASSLE